LFLVLTSLFLNITTLFLLAIHFVLPGAKILYFIITSKFFVQYQTKTVQFFTFFIFFIGG